jgi:hypothetical protein
MYLRNQNTKDESFKELYKKRAECEKIHGLIKDTVKFDVRRVRKESAFISPEPALRNTE